MTGQEEEGVLAYVYAVGRDTGSLDEAAALAADAGVAGAPVHVVRAAGLGALVAAVPQDRYGEDGFKAQLDDIEALERTARAHHAVVAAAFEAATVLPMRLATVYRDDERVARMVTAQAAEFETQLRRLDGTSEWSVKISTDPERISVPSVAVPAAPGGGRGRAYLRQRLAQRDSRRSAHHTAQALTEQVLAAAREFAVAHVSHRPQQGPLVLQPGENVANLAFLVPSSRGEAFSAAVGALDARAREGAAGVRVDISGPWAPYSFATPVGGQETADDR